MQDAQEHGSEQQRVIISINKPFLDVFLFVMAHLIAIGLSLFIMWHAQPGSSLFSWHPTLMVLGFAFFMYEAILMFSRSSSLIPSVARATKTKYHWILQVSAVLCAIGGFLSIFINKNRNNKSHFVSWHGLLGGIAVFMACFQTMMGTSLLYPSLPIVNNFKLAMLKKIHALSGTVVFILACLAMFLGFYSTWFQSRVGLYNLPWWVSAVCPIVFAASVNNQVAQVYLCRTS